MKSVTEKGFPSSFHYAATREKGVGFRLRYHYAVTSWAVSLRYLAARYSCQLHRSRRSAFPQKVFSTAPIPLTTFYKGRRSIGFFHTGTDGAEFFHQIAVAPVDDLCTVDAAFAFGTEGGDDQCHPGTDVRA